MRASIGRLAEIGSVRWSPASGSTASTSGHVLSDRWHPFEVGTAVQVKDVKNLEVACLNGSSNEGDGDSVRLMRLVRVEHYRKATAASSRDGMHGRVLSWQARVKGAAIIAGLER
jgi:hypothetical protein